jgi:Mrp family chromosome partitioning ATPase
METVVRTVETPAGRLAVVGSGKRDRWRPGLLARRDVHELLGRVAANVDVLIVVCPPVETSSVAFDLASVADEGVIAVRRGGTTATALARNVAELRTLDLRIAGAVLVGRK